MSSNEINYQVDESRSASFYSEIRKYWPNLPDNSLVPDYAGVRPKIEDRNTGELLYDFKILGPETHSIPGLIHLLGIESPGLTSSLSLANIVMSKLGLD
mmetsp:Transcript_1841/g.2368  ORF Transcript_1841/g.2368 Transcript_1841/m.2368 type:complete len:99 (-) Transcript_1841:10-306(-)